MTHPILPGENFPLLQDGDLNEQLNFRDWNMNEFTLKYLAKFILNHRVN